MRVKREVVRAMLSATKPERKNERRERVLHKTIRRRAEKRDARRLLRPEAGRRDADERRQRIIAHAFRKCGTIRRMFPPDIGGQMTIPLA